MKVEVLTRLFQAFGLLDEELLKRANTKKFLKPHLSCGRHREAMPLTKQDREMVLSGFQKAGLLNQAALVGLQRLVEDRDRINHQEGRESRRYRFEDIQRCKSDV